MPTTTTIETTHTPESNAIINLRIVLASRHNGAVMSAADRREILLTAREEIAAIRAARAARLEWL